MFRDILHELIRGTRGAIGAVFLDWEGETVELVSERPLDADDHDLKVIGAYQGLFLARLRDLCSETEIGAPHRFKVEFANTRTLSCDLKDGYYLVLIMDADASEGLAWHRLSECRAKLLKEM